MNLLPLPEIHLSLSLGIIVRQFLNPFPEACITIISGVLRNGCIFFHPDGLCLWHHLFFAMSFISSTVAR